MTMKLRKDSQIPAYMAYPRFLLTMDISETAKLIYVLLLDRARLSMKNEGWEDEQGHVFIYYTIADLASASGRSEMTVKNALAALEQKNLISRKRQGAGLPSKIYVQVQTELVSPDGQVLSLRQTKNCPQVISKEKRKRNLSEIMTMRREIPNIIPSLEATVFHQLPAQTCHRQICCGYDPQLNLGSFSL